MIKCIYCTKEIEPESAIVTEVGTACNDCAIRPESCTDKQPHNKSQESESQESQESTESPFNLMRAFRELQWIRLKQCSEGETDPVIMKRSLAEILIMMEKEINTAANVVTELQPEATLNARYHMLAAVCFGLAYLSTHPGPN